LFYTLSAVPGAQSKMIPLLPRPERQKSFSQ
jgi:hypothetical protein